MPDFSKVTTGDPLNISAGAWNTMTDAARDYLSRRGGASSSGPLFSSIVPSVTVIVRNDTGADLDYPGVLALGDPVISAVDAPQDLQQTPGFAGDTPAATTDAFALILEPLADGEYGRGVVAGVAVCDIDVSDTGHLFARPKVGDVTQLESAASGPARIVSIESGTGTKRAVVLMGQGDGAGSAAPHLLLVEVTVSSTSHTVKRKTWLGVVADYAPLTTYTGVRSTTGSTLPVGTLGYLDPIPDVSGEYWMSPNAGYASGTLPGLVSTVAQTFAGIKYFLNGINVIGGTVSDQITAASTPANQFWIYDVGGATFTSANNFAVYAVNSGGCYFGYPMTTSTDPTPVGSRITTANPSSRGTIYSNFRAYFANDFQWVSAAPGGGTNTYFGVGVLTLETGSGATADQQIQFYPNAGATPISALGAQVFWSNVVNAGGLGKCGIRLPTASGTHSHAYEANGRRGTGDGSTLTITFTDGEATAHTVKIDGGLVTEWTYIASEPPPQMQPRFLAGAYG